MDKSLQTTVIVIGVLMILSAVVFLVTGSDTVTPAVIALAGVRPEEVTDWRRASSVPVSGGSFDHSPDSQAQAAELAVERAKRVVERGGHAAIVLDSLEALPPAVQRRVFGAARATEEGGTLTVIASIGMAWEPQRFATTRIMLDPPAPGSAAPHVSAARSATLRADLLG